jgi:hypothetical protein
MPWENPWAFDEARKRIRESKESEVVVIEKRKEDFEKGKEKIYSKKKLDVFELRRRIETGQSLNMLKSDIRAALENGQISIDTYDDALRMLDKDEQGSLHENIVPEYTLPPWAFPLSDTKLAQYFDNQKFGDNPLIDIAGFVYGFAQGSLFLVFLLGRIILDTLLLPIDIYKLSQK